MYLELTIRNEKKFADVVIIETQSMSMMSIFGENVEI